MRSCVLLTTLLAQCQQSEVHFNMAYIHIKYWIQSLVCKRLNEYRRLKNKIDVYIIYVLIVCIYVCHSFCGLYPMLPVSLVSIHILTCISTHKTLFFSKTYVYIRIQIKGNSPCFMPVPQSGLRFPSGYAVVMTSAILSLLLFGNETKQAQWDRIDAINKIFKLAII